MAGLSEGVGMASRALRGLSTSPVALPTTAGAGSKAALGVGMASRSPHLLPVELLRPLALDGAAAWGAGATDSVCCGATAWLGATAGAGGGAGAGAGAGAGDGAGAGIAEGAPIESRSPHFDPPVGISVVGLAT